MVASGQPDCLCAGAGAQLECPAGKGQVTSLLTLPQKARGVTLTTSDIFVVTSGSQTHPGAKRGDHTSRWKKGQGHSIEYHVN